MDSYEKREQILGFANEFGVRRPKQMPKDFVRMEYAEGLDRAAEYAYRACLAILTEANAAGKLDGRAARDLKNILTVWSGFVYSSAQETADETLAGLQEVFYAYDKKAREVAMTELRKQVAKYLEKTAEGLKAMETDNNCIVGRQDAEYYRRAEATLSAARDYVLSAVEFNTPEAHSAARRIVAGADGTSGVAAFRKGVTEKMAPSISILEDALREAARWSRLMTAGAKKVKKKDEFSLPEKDEFSLFAEMPNLGAKLGQFSAAVGANRSKLEKQIEKKRAEREAAEQELRKLEEKRLNYRKKQLNGEISASEALAKVKEIDAKMRSKQEALDSDDVARSLEESIEANAELYRAIDYIRQLWDFSEAILTNGERYELFSDFPYSDVLNVLQGGTEHEANVAKEIYVARDGINRKIEARRASSERFKRLWSQANRTEQRESLKAIQKKETLAERNKAAEDELNAMFGTGAEPEKTGAEKEPAAEEKLDDLLV